MSIEHEHPGEPGSVAAVPPEMDGGACENHGVVGARLQRLRGKLVRRRVFQEMALLVAGVVAVLLGAGAIDFALRFPALIREVFWLAGLGVILWFVMRRVVPALRFRPLRSFWFLWLRVSLLLIILLLLRMIR